MQGIVERFKPRMRETHLLRARYIGTSPGVAPGPDGALSLIALQCLASKDAGRPKLKITPFPFKIGIPPAVDCMNSSEAAFLP